MVTGLICILGDIIAEFNKMINPWVKRFLAISSFLFFNFCRCAMAIALSVNIIVVVFIVFYVVSLIIILGLNSKKEVVKSSAFSKALGKIHNQKILSIQLFDVDRVRVGEYDEYRFQRLDGVSQNNIHDGVSQKEIAAGCLIEAGSLTSILNRMEEKDLIERKMLNGNRRTFHIFMTESGKKNQKLVEEAFKKIEKTALNGISEEEQKQFMDIFCRIYRNLADMK